MTRADEYNQCSNTCLGLPAYEAWFDQTDMNRYNYHITSCGPKVQFNIVAITFRHRT